MSRWSLLKLKDQEAPIDQLHTVFLNLNNQEAHAILLQLTELQFSKYHQPIRLLLVLKFLETQESAELELLLLMYTRLDPPKEVPTKLVKSLHTKLQVLPEYLVQDPNQDQEFTKLATQVYTSPAQTLAFINQELQEPTKPAVHQHQVLLEHLVTSPTKEITATRAAHTEVAEVELDSLREQQAQAQYKALQPALLRATPRAVPTVTEETGDD